MEDNDPSMFDDEMKNFEKLLEENETANRIARNARQRERYPDEIEVASDMLSKNFSSYSSEKLQKLVDEKMHITTSRHKPGYDGTPVAYAQPARVLCIDSGNASQTIMALLRRDQSHDTGVVVMRSVVVPPGTEFSQVVRSIDVERYRERSWDLPVVNTFTLGTAIIGASSSRMSVLIDKYREIGNVWSMPPVPLGHHQRMGKRERNKVFVPQHEAQLVNSNKSKKRKKRK